MRILKTQDKVVAETIVEKIVCNKCGKELDNNFGQSPCVGTFDFSYGSGHDGNLFRVDLCDNCYEEFDYSLKFEPDKLV